MRLGAIYIKINELFESKKVVFSFEIFPPKATSSIDTRTEKIVQAGMDNLMKGRSTFVIAHRLSTIKNADCIVVLEHGKIIEKGSHDELMEKKGKYYRLYTGNSITA